jgi:hypothetical protein
LTKFRHSFMESLRRLLSKPTATPNFSTSHTDTNFQQRVSANWTDFLMLCTKSKTIALLSPVVPSRWTPSGKLEETKDSRVSRLTKPKV